MLPTLLLLAAAAVILARALPTGDGTALAAGFAAAATAGWLLVSILHRPWRLQADGEHTVTVSGGPRPVRALLRPCRPQRLDLRQVRLVDLTSSGLLVFSLAPGGLVAAPCVLFALDPRVRTTLSLLLREPEVTFLSDPARAFISISRTSA